MKYYIYIHIDTYTHLCIRMKYFIYMYIYMIYTNVYR